MGKKSFSRAEAEKAEGLDTVKNEVPENRLQSEQQVAKTDDALDTKVAQNGFGLKKTQAKGSKLKQQAIAEVISGGSDSGMGISAGGRNVSGTVGGILTANNSTPVAGKVRDKTRVGKKLDRLATRLNNTPNEQALITFDESKPLADAANKDQGYNGTYRNEFARSQKKSGAVPGDLLFERSADLILKDQLYFTDGQIVLPANTDAAKCAYTPTKSYVGKDQMKDYRLPIGDFLTRAGHFKLNQYGEVVQCYFDVDDITAIETDADLANKASAFRLTHSNRAELDRIAMDAKAGDEKADIWTPLARAVSEPSKVSYMLSAIEAQTGAHAYLAYAKASTNFSYQLNRALKDGQDIVGPAVEQLCGLNFETDDSKDYTALHATVGACFNTNDYDAGYPALMIEAYDSKAKYNNKADLLLQPRGFRMHLQTADNNINALRVPETFVNVFAGNEVFSTIDHEYDPLLPICMTDKAGLIDRINLNDMCAFTNANWDLTVSYSNIEEDGGEDDSQDYEEVLVPACVNDDDTTNAKMYVYSKATTHGANVKALSSGSGVIGIAKDGDNISDETIKIIVSKSATVPTGFTKIEEVTAGTPIVIKVLKARDGGTNHDRITKCVLKVGDKELIYPTFGGIFKYHYADLRNNYVVSVKHPLVYGIIDYIEQSIGAKFYTLLGKRKELFIPWIFSTQYASLASYIICAAMPWIQQVRLNSMKDVIYYEDNVHEYPFSGLLPIKEAPFKNYVNFVYNGYDEPLETKVMQPTTAIRWIMPEFFWHVDDTYEDYVAPWYFNETELQYDAIADVTVNPDAAAMSMPSIRSGIRLGCLDTFYGMDEKDIRLSLDRMSAAIFANSKVNFLGVYKYGLTTDGQVFIRFGSGGTPFTMGDILSNPRELGLLAEVPGYLLTPSGSNGVKAINTNGMGTSYRIKVWTNYGANSKNASILASDAVDIDRAANYKQRWYQLDANVGNSNEQILGLVFGMNDEGSAEFNPFIGIDNATAVSNAPDVKSHQRSMWTRLQLLPFAISPFDAEKTTGSDNIDIYDICYMFGLAGFRASDYRESVYNRSKEVVNQGMLFVDDPWVLESPIVIHGAKSTGVSNTQGYEIGK